VRNNAYNVEHPKNKKCFFSEKYDHIPTLTKKGYFIINYFAVEKFVTMSPKERFEELKRKISVFNV